MSKFGEQRPGMISASGIDTIKTVEVKGLEQRPMEHFLDMEPVGQSFNTLPLQSNLAHGFLNDLLGAPHLSALFHMEANRINFEDQQQGKGYRSGFVGMGFESAKLDENTIEEVLADTASKAEPVISGSAFDNQVIDIPSKRKPGKR